ncbi:MAG: dephospho-CoA kinase [Clostridiales bacterium]|nr:dephospho-CoA kinase [Clostridiales bacterium]
MIIIGLTGKTGAGKSTVSSILKENGFFVVDADKTGHDILENDLETKRAVIERFGDDVVGEDGKIVRSILAKKVFSSPEKLNELNAITHPAITKKIFSDIAKAGKEGFGAAVVDAAALFESGIDKLCEFTAFVYAPEDVRLERIMKRDGLSEEKALERIRAQKPDDYYAEKADVIIMNYPPYNLYDETSKIFDAMEEFL